MNSLTSSINIDFSQPTNLVENAIHVLVFKTNINAKQDIDIVGLVLNECSLIQRWTVDLDDCDKISRIEAKSRATEHIISIIQNIGYCCEELAD